MQKENISNTFSRALQGNNKFIELAKIAAVVVTTLFFCLSMTTFDDTRNWFKIIFDAITALCIIYGLAANIAKFKRIDIPVLILTILYFISRFISYSLNGIPVTFGGAIMLQAFYLIGISKYLYGGRSRQKVAVITFLTFDIGIMLLNYYNLYFRSEYVEKALEKYLVKGMLAETNMFQSKNYAGMIAGATIVICFAEILNKKFNKTTTLILAPVIVLNLVMLYVHSHCRSGQLGVIVIAMLTAAIIGIKRIDSARNIVAFSLIFCFLTLIPLYGLVYWHDNNQYLDNTPVEQKIDDASSFRYAIWKTTILSQEGHLLFGYGNNTNAAKKKNAYIESCDPDKVSVSYIMAAEHKRQHNGYLAQLNETGIVGSVLLLLLLLARIRGFRGRFRDGQWDKLLLIYIFWLNLFEAKLILANFFTGFLLMIMLLPSGEDNNYEKASEKS